MAGTQVLDQVAGARVMDQVAGTHEVVKQVAGTQVYDSSSDNHPLSQKLDPRLQCVLLSYLCGFNTV